MSTEAYSPESRDYMSVFRQRKWWIIGTTAIVTGAAIVHALLQTPLYRSTATVLVQPVAVPGPSVSSPFVNIDTELQIASSAQVAQTANAALIKAGIEPGEVTVSTSTTTDTLEFAGVSTDARAARATAEAYAEAYLEVRTEQLTSAVDQSLESVVAIIKDLNGKILHAQQELASSTTAADSQFWAARISSLTSQITTDQTLQNDLFLAKSSSVGQILQPARLPQRPYSPNYVRDVLLGLFLGLLLGCGLALLRDRADRSLRGRDEIEQAAGSPLIAMIPEAASLKERLAVVGNGDPRAAEAYRSLRTKILFTASQQPFKTIMITSPRAGEGKTTTAANVAVALAQADKKVVLVSSDLRRPTLQRYFPNMNGTGLSDVLAGTAELGSTITPGSDQQSGPHLEWLSRLPTGQRRPRLRRDAEGDRRSERRRGFRRAGRYSRVGRLRRDRPRFDGRRRDPGDRREELDRDDDRGSGQRSSIRRHEHPWRRPQPLRPLEVPSVLSARRASPSLLRDEPSER